MRRHVYSRAPPVLVLVAGSVILFIASTFIPQISIEYADRPLVTRQSNVGVKLCNQHLQFPHRSHGRHQTDGRWLSLPGMFELYAYSAFYDDRVSLQSLPVIRIIAISEELQNQILFCVVQYDDNGEHKLHNINHFGIGAGAYRHEKNFKEYVLECALGSERVPRNVGIVLKRDEEPSWMLPVEVPTRMQTKLNLLACVSVSYWRIEPYRIVEWMEMQKLLGVGLVVIYNNSLDIESARIFQYYALTGFVELRQSHNFLSDLGEVTYHMHMSPVINDCMYRHMHHAKKMLVIDIDEYIIPRITFDLQAMLDYIESSETEYHPARSYLFRNAYFFSDFVPDVSKPWQLVTLSYRRRANVSELGYSAKSIIDPMACHAMHNHYCWGVTKLYNDGSHMSYVEPDVALLHHYKHCHLDEFEVKQGLCAQAMSADVHDDAMLRYELQLRIAVDKQLTKLHLVKLSQPKKDKTPKSS